MRTSLKWLFIFLLLMLAACAAPHSTDAPFLLEQDYRAMSDSELIAYEQELGDEVLRGARAAKGGDVSLGVGFGSWGSHSGVGVGVNQWLGGGGDSAMQRELQLRREEVRAEMRSRGLLQ